MRKKSALISCLAATAVVGGLVYWLLPRGEMPAPKPDAAIQDQDTETIAYKWQWKNFTNTKPAPNTDAENSGSEQASPNG